MGLLTLEAAKALAAEVAVACCDAWLKSANGLFAPSDLAIATLLDGSALASMSIALPDVLLLRACA